MTAKLDNKLTFIAWVAHAFWLGYMHGADQPFSQMLPTEDDLASTIDGAKAILANPGLTAEQMHNKWWFYRLEQGWTYGPVKDPVAKTHPDMVPWGELPAVERRKDYNFHMGVEYGLKMWELLQESQRVR